MTKELIPPDPDLDRDGRPARDALPRDTARAPGRRAGKAGEPVGNRTLASRLAREIEQEIIRRGWPVGEGLGSESALMEQYRVGRSVLREAVRILESRWVAKPRPGPGGGLVVTAPDPDGVRDVTRVFLDFARVRPEHLYQAWMALEVVAVRELAGSIDAKGIDGLRATLLAERAEHGDPTITIPAPGRRAAATEPRTPGLHVEIVRMAGNPAIELFVRVLIDLARSHGDAADALGGCRDHATHTQIVEAIIAGDAAVAQHHVRRCIQRLA
ncbi:MAG: FadR/GntR family transcriptional regulator, partial [Frankia sp.]